MLSVEIVIYALEPVMRLQHHDVTFRTIQLSRRAVTYILCICIVVRVAVMERIIGHYTIKIIHNGINTTHLHIALCSLLGDFSEYPVT